MSETTHDSSTGVAGDLPDGAEIMRQFIPNSPFAVFLGIELVDITPGRAMLRLARRPELITIGDTIHGGAVGSLIDTAVMAASWSRGAPKKLRGATASLSLHYLAAANEGDLVAEAVLLRAGSSLCFVEVEVYTEPARALVAKGTATYKIG